MPEPLGLDSPLSLSPNGETLAFAVLDSKTGQSRVVRVNVDGSGCRSLTSVDDAIPVIRWTPKGSDVMFSLLDSTPARILKVRADGGPAESTGIQIDGLVDWDIDSDGGRIAYTTTPPNVALRAIDNVGAFLRARR